MSEEDRRDLEHRLKQINYQLLQQEDRVKELRLRAGVIAKQLVDKHGVSRNKIAPLIGVSQPYVSTLIERAEHLPFAEDGVEPVPILAPAEALSYLSETNKKICRVIAGFEESDVLLNSGLDPDRFVSEFNHRVPIRVPSMLWYMQGGRWIGIDSVSVGYGGTGSDNAHKVLTKAGVDTRTADSVYEHRFMDLDLVDGNHYLAGTRALHGLDLPSRDGPVYVVRLPKTELRGTYEHGKRWPVRDTLHAAAPTVEGVTEFERWIDYLDYDGVPDWLRGPRMARVMLSYDEARKQGFVEENMLMEREGYGPYYTVIVEQGRLQLWLSLYRPLEEEKRQVADEAYTALTYADLYPEDLARLDERSKLTRYIHEMVGLNKVPEYVDVSQEGNQHLSFIPLQRAETSSG